MLFGNIPNCIWIPSVLNLKRDEFSSLLFSHRKLLRVIPMSQGRRQTSFHLECCHEYHHTSATFFWPKIFDRNVLVTASEATGKCDSSLSRRGHFRIVGETNMTRFGGLSYSCWADLDVHEESWPSVWLQFSHIWGRLISTKLLVSDVCNEWTWPDRGW